MDAMPFNEDDLVSSAESNNSAGANTALQSSPSAFPLQFSKELQEFYKSHNFDLSGDTISCYCPYRYIRLNPRYDKKETLDMLLNEVRNLRHDNTGKDTEENESNNNNASPKPTAVPSVPWLETKWAFYALPANFPLSTSPCFRSGKIYGMDVSSGAGVAVLLTDYYDNANEKVQSAIKEETDASVGDNLDATGELRILDLCCSPGLKLLQMADFFHRKSSTNSITDTHKQKPVKVVGVDICKHRINVCKSIVQKYFIDSETSGQGERSKESPGNVNIQLYLEDGTTFGVNRPTNVLASSTDFNNSHRSSNLIFDSSVAIEEMVQRNGKRKRMNKSARAREKKRLRQISTFESGSVVNEAHDIQNGSESNHDEKESQTTSIELFDYVLVDAECSTDGSFKHIKERIKESSFNKLKKDDRHTEENKRLTDPGKLGELVDLQRKLISSGFRLLKDGGTVVYSTCSLSEDQNEKVVKWLLESNEDAVLIPIHFPLIKNTKFVTEGSLAGTVRFYPNLVQEAEPTTLLLGDGFFVAKIRKRPNLISRKKH
jgi:16S rRNA C967 or C1407 C5-methylase (RsmB/RsmF family)